MQCAPLLPHLTPPPPIGRNLCPHPKVFNSVLLRYSNSIHPAFYDVRFERVNDSAAVVEDISGKYIEYAGLPYRQGEGQSNGQVTAQTRAGRGRHLSRGDSE